MTGEKGCHSVARICPSAARAAQIPQAEAAGGAQDPVRAKLEKLLSKHISFPLHAHPKQAYLFSFIKVKESLRIKRPQVRILLGAPQKLLTSFAPLRVFLLLFEAIFPDIT